MPMKYNGFWNHANDKPESYICVWISDWNKDYWGFYVYINKNNYEADTKELLKLIDKLNYRDGDVYVELIDHSPDLKELYEYMWERDWYQSWYNLNPILWASAEEAINNGHKKTQPTRNQPN